jgi:hypothetical protein
MSVALEGWLLEPDDRVILAVTRAETAAGPWTAPQITRTELASTSSNLQ